jgi:hypothetical protein
VRVGLSETGGEDLRWNKYKGWRLWLIASP